MAKHRLGTGTKTVLTLGAVRAPVALYKTVKEDKESSSWDSAGPNGGRLRLQSLAAPAPPPPEPTDPLAVEEPPPYDQAREPEPDFKALQESDPPTRTAGGPVMTPAESAFAREADEGGRPPVAPPDQPPTQEEMDAAQAGTGPAIKVTAEADGTTYERIPQSQGETGGPLGPAGEYRQTLVEEGTGEVVLRDEVRKGLRLEDETFVDLTEHLSRITEDSRLDAMRVVSFIRREQVPRSRIQGSYYLASDDPDAPRALKLLLAGMRRRERVAVVIWTKRTKASLGVVVPDRHSGALVILQVEWERNWIDAPPRVLTHVDAKVRDEEVEAVCRLIDAMADSVASLDELEDPARRARADLRAHVEEHGEAPELEERKGDRSDAEADWVALLNASVEARG